MDEATFRIQGTISHYYADRAGKVVRFKVKTRGIRDQIHDVKYFGALAGIGKGDYVLVTGRPGAEKVGTEQGRDGKTYDRWATMLVAEHIEVVEGAQRSIAGTTPRAKPKNDDDIPF